MRDDAGRIPRLAARARRISDCTIATPASALISSAVSRYETTRATTEKIRVNEVSAILAPHVGRLGYLRAQRGEVVDALRLTRTTSGERTQNFTGRRRRDLEHSPDRDARPDVYHGDTVRVSRNRAVDDTGLRARSARRHGRMGGRGEKRSRGIYCGAPCRERSRNIELCGSARVAESRNRGDAASSSSRLGRDVSRRKSISRGSRFQSRRIAILRTQWI